MSRERKGNVDRLIYDGVFMHVDINVGCGSFR